MICGYKDYKLPEFYQGGKYNFYKESAIGGPNQQMRKR